MARRSRGLRLASIVNGGNTGLVTKATGSAVAAMAIDGASEYFKLPVLNDESNLFPGRSNAEVVLYGAGTLGLVLSAFAMLSKQRLFGNVGADLVGPSAGALIGTYAWENFVAPALIRNNPA